MKNWKALIVTLSLALFPGLYVGYVYANWSEGGQPCTECIYGELSSFESDLAQAEQDMDDAEELRDQETELSPEWFSHHYDYCSARRDAVQYGTAANMVDGCQWNQPCAACAACCDDRISYCEDSMDTLEPLISGAQVKYIQFVNTYGEYSGEAAGMLEELADIQGAYDGYSDAASALSGCSGC